MAKAMAIKKGYLIIKSQPYAYVLSNNYRGQVCDYCFTKSDDLRKCTQCLFSFYCDKTCQKSAWKDHKIECLNLKRVYPDQPHEDVRLMSRIIYKSKKKPNENEKLGNATYRYEDLMSHKEEIKRDYPRNLSFTMMCGHVRNFIRDDCPSNEELLDIYGKITVNSFGIYSEMKKFGTGLYLGASKLDHSCQPNAVLVFDGPTLYVSALEDISHFDTSHIFIAYTDIMTPTAERRKLLKANYYFDCNCSKCQDTERDLLTRSIKCANKNCNHPTVIKKNSFTCLRCGDVKFDQSKRNQIEELTIKCQQALDEMNELKKWRRYPEIYEIAIKCIQQVKSTFHLLNIQYSRILEKAFDASSALSNWKPASKHAMDQLVSFRYYFGKSHPVLAVQLLHTGFALFSANKFIEAEEILQEALDAVSVTHPSEHPMYSSCKGLISMCQFSKQLRL